MPQKIEEQLEKQGFELPESPESKKESQEKGLEQGFENLEQIEDSAEQAMESESSSTPEQMEGASVAPAQSTQLSAKQQQIKRVEKVLESGLEDTYIEMQPRVRKKFKKVGEKTAKKLNKLLNKTKVKIKKIIILIKKWLSIIPGTNKYFLEQEAKIKADELIKMRENSR